jgi:hypothetical protein
LPFDFATFLAADFAFVFGFVASSSSAAFASAFGFGAAFGFAAIVGCLPSVRI